MEGSLCLNQDTISLINKGCTYFSLTESVPTCFLVFCSLNGKAVTSPEVFMWICYQSVMVQNVEVGFFQAMVTSINQPCSVTKWFSSDWNFLVPDYLSVFHPLWYPWVPFVHVPILAIFLLLTPLNFCCFKPPSCILLSTSRKHRVYGGCRQVTSNSATLWTARLLCPWDFPGKNTGVGCYFLFQGFFPTQDETPVSCSGQILYRWTTQGGPTECLRNVCICCIPFVNTA